MKWSNGVEKKLFKVVSVHETQFGFVPERGTIDDVFVSRMLHEEFGAKEKKLHMCFVDLERTFDGVSRKVL